MPLLVVRHAHAGRRSAYLGDDRLRPLSTRGRARSYELVPLLSAFRPKRILSSPFARCYETVRPLADALALPVESIEELAEGRGDEAVQLMRLMAGESAVLCTHGDVAIELLEELTPGVSDAARSRLRLQKGDIWVVQCSGASLAIVDHLRRPRGGGRKPVVSE